MPSQIPLPAGGLVGYVEFLATVDWATFRAPKPPTAPKIPIIPVWERLSEPKNRVVEIPFVHQLPQLTKGRDFNVEATYPKPRWIPAGGRPVTPVTSKPASSTVNARRAFKKYLIYKYIYKYLRK
jgi:hypothetical protein